MKTIRRPSAVRCHFNLAVKLGGATALLLLLSVLDALAGANPPQFIDLGTLGGTGSSAAAINRVGQVVGSSTAADGWNHPFIWDAASGMYNLGSAYSGNATAINNLGQVVGTIVVWQLAIDYAGGNNHTQFTWTLCIHLFGIR